MNRLTKKLLRWVPGLILAIALIHPAQHASAADHWPSLAELKEKWKNTPLEQVEAAAQRGDRQAQHFLGFCNVEGFRTRQDVAAGVRWYQRALLQGYLPSANNLGFAYKRGLLGSNNVGKAVAYYTYAATNGFAPAQTGLGILYRDGTGVERDPSEAMKWFRLAAGQGHTTAMVEIGRLYRFGQGVPADLIEAEKWFQKAVIKGEPLPRLNLGLLYEDEGRMTEAVNYYQQAAAQGSVEAMIQLYLCLWEGRGVNADHTQAMQWLTKAADTGNAYAQCLMGYRCENTEWEGEGINHHLPQPNWRGAFNWYRLSAEQNWAGGQYCLGILYLDGHGAEKNEELSLKLIQAAADQGHTEAITKLAGLYAEGIGEPRNQQDQPMQLLKRAGAWSELIFRYEYALGTERDLVAAARCSYQAALSNTWQSVTLKDRVEFKPSQQLQGVQLITPSDEHVQIFGPPKTDDVPRVLSLYLKAATENGAAAEQIGRMYLNGQDAPKNPAQAWVWFSIATRAGNVESRQQVSVAKSRMSEQEIKDAPVQLAALVQELSQVASAIEAQ